MAIFKFQSKFAVVSDSRAKYTPIFNGRGCGTVKPFPRKQATVRLAALQNFVLSAVSVTIVFIG